MTTAPRDGATQLRETTLRKARGAFFTPPELADFVSRWTIRTASDVVLEPSCGEAAFLLAAAQRLDAIGARPSRQQLEGIEIHPASAQHAIRVVAQTGHEARVQVNDFFAVPSQRRFDAVIGNPPYVRYQSHVGPARLASREAALRGGVGLTGLASTWAAATIHAAEFLKPGGRLGLVLPAELLTVNYAADVRRYLMERFGRVQLVMFTERVFPDVQEEVVLLLADDALAVGGTDHCELRQVQSAIELTEGLDDPETRHRWWPSDYRAKWTPALLSVGALDVYTPVSGGDGFSSLQTWGETTLGAVTGRNNFFAVSPACARALKLRDHETVRLSPPGSRHLRGLSLTTAAWKQLGDEGARTLLFRPGLRRPDMSSGARRYIAHGERDGVDQAYKCRMRTPWWQVPINNPADLLFTYMNADTPRITTNSAGAVHLNSVHGIYLHSEHKRLGTAALPLASLNSITLLGAELVGRAYGGGMLKLEPSEADQLPVPSPAVVAASVPQLQQARGSIREALRRRDLSAAVRIVDEVILQQQLGIDAADHAELVAAHAVMAARRMARGANPGKR
ncbi:HsdM family class I SAM-dependent methyltransferase [Mycobacterium marinum]|uniref:HsdM family class I SAM-dependent methyltransferase n=1 Tax=Mycobacterium marinum TaxID=1781 RepID=UPI0021C3FE9C|nr:N-6 DNA methylase [Mycobacterium marinum]